MLGSGYQPFRQIRNINDIDASLLNTANGLMRLPDSVVVAGKGDTDEERGDDLLAAYATATGLTPGGNALSATNRAAVVLLPGRYEFSDTNGPLQLDTNYVDVIALCPQAGGHRQATDRDKEDGTTSLDEFRPPITLLYSETDAIPALQQLSECTDVRLCGFGVAHLSSSASSNAFDIECDDNSESIYEMLYIWQRRIEENQYRPTSFAKHVAGTWRWCIANSYAWRCGSFGNFKATMEYCEAGPMSYGGDTPGTSFTTCYLYRNKAVGLHDVTVGWGLGSGAAAFGGCDAYGIPSTSDSWFIENESGERSYSLGKNAAGNYIRNRGGALCYGATVSDTYPGEFSGYGEDNYGETGSFGGSAVDGYGTLSGEIVRCTSEGSDEPWRCEGATIRDCRLTVTGTDKDCIELLDSATTITGSELIANGTGNSVASDDPGVNSYDIEMSHCLLSDDISDDITNTIEAGYNVLRA